MKNLLLLALVIVAMTSCQKEQEELLNGVNIVAQYSIKLENTDGLSLFSSSTPNYIKINDIRLKYLADDGVVKTYVCDYPGVQADRPFGVGINPQFIPIYDGNKSMAIVEIIAPVHKFGAMHEIPEGETPMLNYIHWSDTMVDKVEVIMLRGRGDYGGLYVYPKEIKINDQVIYTRSAQNGGYPIVFKKVTDGLNSTFVHEIIK